ncbi:hypothetical protein [Arthrobacter sp. NtRootA1]|uniref:hypothetical protein n=1 Tax=Arthrobacter sp. NtRootA1 TaxID=2830983 RepID=UPI0021E18F31|nr:hypothetical protein [Arthrobacter sp. NtRootA1]
MTAPVLGSPLELLRPLWREGGKQRIDKPLAKSLVHGGSAEEEPVVNRAKQEIGSHFRVRARLQFAPGNASLHELCDVRQSVGDHAFPVNAGQFRIRRDLRNQALHDLAQLRVAGEFHRPVHQAHQLGSRISVVGLRTDVPHHVQQDSEGKIVPGAVSAPNRRLGHARPFCDTLSRQAAEPVLCQQFNALTLLKEVMAERGLTPEAEAD